MTDLKDVQALELKMLDHTIDILDSLNIKWFAAYGTLLGAVRHGGMIPWDDDIDICVSRKDFNKLCSIGSKVFKSPYFFQTPETDSICNTIIHIRYDGTSAIGTYAQDVDFHKGVFIDIFPIERVFEDDVENEKLHQTIDFILNDIRYDKCDHVRKNQKETKANANFFRFLNDLLYQIDDMNSESSKMSFTTMWRYNGDSLCRLNSDWFNNTIEVDFKGLNHNMKIPSEYDNILTSIYDNWRVPDTNKGNEHGKPYFDLENNYTLYEKMNREDFIKLFK